MTGTTIDTGLVAEVVGVIKSGLALFKEYPLNVYIIGSIMILGFTIVRKAKKAATR